MARPAGTLGLLLPADSRGGRPALPAFLLAFLLPLVFLHVRYQPSLEIEAGSTVVGIQLADLAVLAAVAAGALAGLRLGFRPLRAALPVWATAGALLLLIGAATLHPLLWRQGYAFSSHLVSALKLGEYALLAPALALLLRDARTLRLLASTLVAWAAAAAGFGLLQFLGLAGTFDGSGPGRRQPSFLGIHDFAALSGASLALALAVLTLGPGRRGDRRLAWLAGASGLVGLVLSAAVAALVGLGLAAAAALAVARLRGALTAARTAATVAVVGVAAAGVLLMRAGDITDFARFLGLGRQEETTVQTYTQRTLLAYIGLRIFLDHPATGVGWQGSGEPHSFQPYLADARRRFPHAPPLAFPSPAHPWGVQNAYVQALADMGVPGLALLVAFFASVAVVGLGAARRAPPALAVPALAATGWLLVAAGAWNGLGLVAGIPLDALTWTATGAVAAVAAQTGRGRP